MCVGFRWFLPITGLVLAFVPVWLSENRSRVAQVLFALCFGIAQFHVFSGLTGPWQASQWELWLSS